jgi:signal transduction histidine kinase
VSLLSRPLALPEAGASLSLFALAQASRERHVFEEDRRGLQRVTRDIENTILAEALPARVFAGFQKWSFMLPVLHRYTRLARIAHGVWVFGLPDVDPPTIPGLTWVSVDERHALASEWFLLADCERYFATLAAEALSGFDVPPERRRFRVVWSFDDALVCELTGRLGALLGLPATPAGRARDYAGQLAQVDATVSRLVTLLHSRGAGRAQAERFQEDLTGLLMHDLRNPLSVILARTDLLTSLTAPTADRVARSAAAIRAEARRLDETLVSLVDVVRIEAGTLQPVKADVDVRALVDAVVEAHRAVAQGQDKAIAAAVEAPAGAMVRGDRDRLGRVLSSLLGNALKYTEREGHVELRARATPAGMEFAVSDDGPGVPVERRGELFQRFDQVPSAHAPRPATGLGLYFCRLMVEAHGGTIAADNRPGRGMTFRFTLPPTPTA